MQKFPDVNAALAAGESRHVEFKDKISDEALVEVATCLANGGGGGSVLLIGVADDATVVGAAPRHGKTTDPRKIEALLANKTRPALVARVEICLVDGKQVIVVNIPSMPIPVATTAGKYLRRSTGSDGRPACVPYFVFEAAGPGFAADPSSVVVAGARWRDIDPAEIERLRRLIRASNTRGDAALTDLGDEEICRALGGLDANGSIRGIRRAALLMFGREEAISRLLPTHRASWQVLEQRRVDENDTYSTPLLRLFDDLFVRFRRRNDLIEELLTPHRVEVRLFAEQVFREALVNAIIHRDYTEMGTLQVQLTRDCLRVDSPGDFPEGVMLSNLLDTPPRPRNPLLADAFKRAGLAERTGRGIETIYFEQLRYGRPPPLYRRDDRYVRLTLSRSAPDLRFIRWLSEEIRQGRPWSVSSLLLLRYGLDNTGMTLKEAADVVQQDLERTRAALSAMVEEGVLETRGEGKARTYQPSAAIYRLLGSGSAYVRVRRYEPLQQEAMVLQHLQNSRRVTRREVADLCKLTGPQATSLLARMTAKHRQIELLGEKRGSYYIWSDRQTRKKR